MLNAPANPHELPADCLPIFIGPADASPALALVGRRGVPADQALVPIRQTAVAIAYLGCLIDAAGTVHEWLELWLERFADDRAPSDGARLTNASHELAFADWRTALCALDRASVVVFRPESAGRPTLIDLTAGRIVPLGDWRLCREDVTLVAAGLGAFESGANRYLVRDGVGTLVAIDADAPADPEMRSVESLLDADARPALAPFNLACGQMFATRWRPASLEEHLAVIEGDGWTPPLHGRTPIVAGPIPSALRTAAETANASLFLVPRLPVQRLPEALHLKLLALHAAVCLVEQVIVATGRPLLSIQLDSFRVSYADSDAHLPLLWTSRLHLVRPSAAVGIAVPDAGRPLFRPSADASVGVFSPDATTLAARGRANARVRETIETQDGFVIEATLSPTLEPIAAGGGDELWIRVLTTGGTVSLIGSADSTDDGRAVRFRSRPTRLAPAAAAWFAQAAGVTIRDVHYEVVRVRGPATDLYALGVLGVRCLLNHPKRSTAVVLDELVGLTAAAATGEGAAPLETQLATLLSADCERLAMLGPQWLTNAAIEPSDALDVIPLSLWSSVLAVLVRLLSGASAHGFAADLGGTADIFAAARQALALAIVRSRSLVLNDVYYNRRVVAVLDEFERRRV